MSSISCAVSSDSSRPTKARVKAYGAMIESVSRLKGTSGRPKLGSAVGQVAHVADGRHGDAEDRAADAEHHDGHQRGRAPRWSGGGARR